MRPASGHSSPASGHSSPIPLRPRPPVRPPPPAQAQSKIPAEELFNPPGRNKRPEKIVIIIRGLPGCGKSVLAKRMKDLEAEHGASAPRILSLDDYFLDEMNQYDYEEELEQSYRSSMFKAFQRTLHDGWFRFIIIDSTNDKLEYFSQYWSLAKTKGFQVYIAEIRSDSDDCARHSVHKRSLQDIQKIAGGWEAAPPAYIRLDLRGLMQDSSIEEVEMGEGSDEEPVAEPPDPISESRWEVNADERDEASLNRLDGLKLAKRQRSPSPDMMELIKDLKKRGNKKDGKKHIRWADLEERNNALKRQKIGFHIGSGWTGLDGTMPELYSATRDEKGGPLNKR